MTKVYFWILVVLLGGTAALVNRPAETAADRLPSVELKQALARVDGWTSGRGIALEAKVVEELKLDDYLFQSFSNELGSVTLYIGYYHSAKKVGAAHDPMVCYPGQGWKVENKRQDSLPMGMGAENFCFSTMIAAHDGQKDLVFYWFQAHDQAAADTFSQKVALFKQKISGGRESNAFVRITTSLQNRSEEDARRLILSFVDSFYPTFLHYLKEV